MATGGHHEGLSRFLDDYQKGLTRFVSDYQDVDSRALSGKKMSTNTYFEQLAGVLKDIQDVDDAIERNKLSADTNNDENYNKRYLLVLEALMMANNADIPCGFRRDPDEPDWPVVVIDLPDSGQVAWHMPPADIKYDGHTKDDVRERIKKFAARVEDPAKSGK